VNPILKDFPDHFETERLSARCPRSGDGAMLAEAVERSRAELKPWLSWVKDENSVEEMEIYARKAVADFVLREQLRFFLFLRADGTFVGNMWLHHIDWDIPCFEIGYWLHTRYTGYGYMTEAIRGLTEFAHSWLGARRLEIRCDTRNVKSKKVADRAGYRLEFTVCNGYRDHENQLRDDFVLVKHGLTRNDR
jgi:RimJ/RimL family protein N-acetyltransferase